MQLDMEGMSQVGRGDRAGWDCPPSGAPGQAKPSRELGEGPDAREEGLLSVLILSHYPGPQGVPGGPAWALRSPRALPDTVQGQQPGSRDRGRPRPKPSPGRQHHPLLLPAPGPPEPKAASTSQTPRPGWGLPPSNWASEGPASRPAAASQPPCPASHGRVPVLRAPAPPSTLQLALWERMHKGHGCVHEHGHLLSASARGDQLGWGT